VVLDEVFWKALRDHPVPLLETAIRQLRDRPSGLKAAIREVLTEAVWQRCYVHFLRNALDYVPRKVDDDCLMELRWFYTGAIWPRSDATSPPGSANGRANTPSCVPGSKTTSRKR
jgi:Transposase, Mutator family